MDTPVYLDSAQANSVVPDFVQRRYGIEIAGLNLLLPQGVSAELLHDQSITRIVLAPPVLRGVANVRGVLMPVFDFSQLISNSSSKAQQVLMLGQFPNALGLLVNGFPLPVTDLQPLETMVLPEILRPYFSAAWQQQGKNWCEIDILGLFRDLAARTAYKE